MNIDKAGFITVVSSGLEALLIRPCANIRQTEAEGRMGATVQLLDILLSLLSCYFFGHGLVVMRLYELTHSDISN